MIENLENLKRDHIKKNIIFRANNVMLVWYLPKQDTFKSYYIIFCIKYLEMVNFLLLNLIYINYFLTNFIISQ